MASYTPSTVAAFVAGNRRVKIVNLTASGNYVTGGDSITAAALGLRRIESFIPNGGATDGTVQYPAVPVFAANNSSVSVKLFESGGAAGVAAAEKANAESLAGVTLRATVIGV